MTSRFGLYAQYYDLLYRDKDYASEAEYVHKLIKQHTPSAHTLLNLGCGTGKHDYALARIGGYTITGVDLSQEMASRAFDNKPADIAGQFSFITADIRTLILGKTFDVIISLFHVISYMVSNDDLQQVIDVAYRHLEHGGIFIFDCWYGPGVLTEPPEIRTKKMANDSINVTRLAHPVLNSVKNTVDVNYTILINNTNSENVMKIKETHIMRYIFASEIELLIKHKFELVQINEWLTDKEPTLTTWNAVFTLKKK